MGGCKICGAPHSACGPSPVVTPTDLRVTNKGDDTMTLKRYDTTVHGNATTLMLSDEDAKRLGLTAADAVGAKPDSGKPAAKARAASNTGRKPANKAAKPAATKASEPPAAPPAAPEGSSGEKDSE